MQTLVRQDEKTRSAKPNPKAAPEEVAVKIEFGHAETRNRGADGLGDHDWKK
jgi:hypothetical protein